MFDLEELVRQEQEAEAQCLATVRDGLLLGAAASVVHEALAYGLSDEVPFMLDELWRDGLLSVDLLAAAIPEVWIHNKAPVTGVVRPGLGQRRWVVLFKAAGFLYRHAQTIGADNTPQPSPYPHPDFRSQPKEVLTVWRGASLTRRYGMSWSLYRECARDFADAAALYGPAGIFRATVPGRAVLAAFGDGREQEIVVNPNMLRSRLVLDETLESAEPGLPAYLRSPPHNNRTT